MRETGKDGYQRKLIKAIKAEFPECIVLKNDANYLQGIPDLTVLNGDRWCFIEVKASATAPFQPNQEHYIKRAQGMSCGLVAYPSNHEETIRGLQRSLKT